jgi:hypothetical protein
MNVVHEVLLLDIINGGVAVIRVKRADGKHTQVQIDSRVVLHDAPKSQFGQVMLHAFLSRGHLLPPDVVTR